MILEIHKIERGSNEKKSECMFIAIKTGKKEEKIKIQGKKG